MSECGEDCTIVLNDLLCFTWCNLELCAEEKLLICVQNFYHTEEAINAFRTLLKVLPISMRGRLLKNTREPNPFLAIIKVLKSVVKEDLPIFVCKDLNNIPNIEITKEKLRSCSKQSFYEEQNNMKSQISEIHDVLSQLKDHCQTLVGKNFNFSQKLVIEKIQKKNSGKFLSNSQSRSQAPQSFMNYFKTEENIDADSSISLEEDIMEDYDELDEDWQEQRLKPKGNKCQKSIGKNIKPNKKKTFSEKKNLHEGKINDKKKGSGSLKIADKNVDDSTIYKCTHCEFSSTSEAASNLHRCFQRLSHQKNTKESEQLTTGPGYPCHVCNLTFKLTNDLKAHKETHNTTDHQCPLCLERFSVEEWLDHVRQCPGNGSTPREDHYCPNCDIFFADKRILLFHMSYHDVAKQFECLECKFRFYTQKAVADHFKSHIESEYKLKCPFCYFRADKNYRIQEHIRSHTGDKPYKCHLCDHSTATYGTLKTHIGSHDSRRNFKCDICGKAYKSNTKLVSHKRIHTNEKPHKCPVCGKCFKLGILMKLHHRIHLDNRYHHCPQCSYRAKSAASLKRHLNAHSNSKSFVCLECNFRANHKRYLDAHIKRQHPKIEVDDDL